MVQNDLSQCSIVLDLVLLLHCEVWLLNFCDVVSIKSEINVLYAFSFQQILRKFSVSIPIRGQTTVVVRFCTTLYTVEKIK